MAPRLSFWLQLTSPRSSPVTEFILREWKVNTSELCTFVALLNFSHRYDDLGTPENVLNPKKKYWETVQPDFKTNSETFAFYQDKPFLIKSSSGEDVKVKAASVTDGLIR
jgi:hypothetical protein